MLLQVSGSLKCSVKNNFDYNTASLVRSILAMLDRTHPGATLCRESGKKLWYMYSHPTLRTKKRTLSDFVKGRKKHLNCKFLKLRLLVNSFCNPYITQSWHHPLPWTLSLVQAAPDTLVASDNMLYSPSEGKVWNLPHKNVTGLFLTWRSHWNVY